MPPLVTARLTIHPWTLAAADVAAAFAVFGDGEVTRFLSRREPDLASQRRALEHLIRRSGRLRAGLGWFALEQRAEGAVVGCGALVPLEQGALCSGPASGAAVSAGDVEVGYHLARAHWGRGYATEAAAALVERGLGPLGLPRVVALVDRDNARSLAVVARLGLWPAGEAERRGRSCLVFACEAQAPQSPGASSPLSSGPSGSSGRSSR